MSSRRNTAACVKSFLQVWTPTADHTSPKLQGICSGQPPVVTGSSERPSTKGPVLLCTRMGSDMAMHGFSRSVICNQRSASQPDIAGAIALTLAR